MRAISLAGVKSKPNVSLPAKLNDYYQLTKPGVTYGNIITAVAGFFLAAATARQFDLGLFIATVVGMTFVVGAACALNNVLDRDIDAVMERTKTRAVASQRLQPGPAATFSIILGLVGTAILAIWTNWLVVAIGVVGFVVYVWLYGAWSKRKSIHGTAVGSVSGALPILAGYCAVMNRIDAAAICLFLALFFWQFPEFYSIAIYRKKEYAKAKVPVMTVVKGVKNTKLQIFVYTILFVASTLALSSLGWTGWVYFVVMALVGVYFIWLAAIGLVTTDDDAWARRMFHTSLLVLIIFSVSISVGGLLP